ncbi:MULTISPECIES: HD-GYP domain-containing protein [unclassified Fusibacter]|uniref:HD-GYP domain-containing protein n=1 Tax=unclassified Fusibacter TaxID=2624464 RepID=UPI001010B328|nr:MULTISPECIES: HD-GYP domain-containing protein [unclassified Fusibacter]MCK8061643.1 HD-GYP domain-containing protein [Fusibacter sp. A2]NPE23827.1 HD-GYP domain-containing protein [Fusibacter sp. A1]RXV58600.1 HD-GYP domain-containing protein [Fusibacter sp. A1]
MRIKHISNVREGDVLGRTLFDDGLRRMVNRGTVLTSSIIDKLEKLGYSRVYISDHTDDLPINPLISDETMIKSIGAVKQVFKDMKRGQHQLKEGQAHPVLETEKFEAVVDDLYAAMFNNDHLMYYMVVLMGSDAYTYRHSVEVSVLSMLTAQALGYDESMVKHIGMGAILHDIGKVQVPDEILNKKGSLTPEELAEVKKHVTYGYEMVKSDRRITAYAKNIILKHHERLDGKGYEGGLLEKEIDDYVNIVTVADIFHALISERVYKNCIPVTQAVSILREGVGQQIKYNVLAGFLAHIAIYPPGTRVKLNNGDEATVIDVKKKQPHKPIISIMKDNKRIEYDLSRLVHLEIESVIE